MIEQNPAGQVDFVLLTMALTRFSCFLLFLLVFASSCKTTPAVVSQPDDRAIREVLGQEFKTVPSPANSYVLYIQQGAGTAAGQSVRFLVTDAATGAVLMKDSILPGYVKWSDDQTLEVLSVPGMLKQGDDLSKYIRRVNVQTQH